MMTRGGIPQVMAAFYPLGFMKFASVSSGGMSYVYSRYSGRESNGQLTETYFLLPSKNMYIIS